MKAGYLFTPIIFLDSKLLVTILKVSDCISFLYEIYMSNRIIKVLQEEMIDKLKEYKATLINSAVTGKIKVLMPKKANTTA